MTNIFALNTFPTSSHRPHSATTKPSHIPPDVCCCRTSCSIDVSENLQLLSPLLDSHSFIRFHYKTWQNRFSVHIQLVWSRQCMVPSAMNVCAMLTANVYSTDAHKKLFAEVRMHECIYFELFFFHCYFYLWFSIFHCSYADHREQMQKVNKWNFCCLLALKCLFSEFLRTKREKIRKVLLVFFCRRPRHHIWYGIKLKWAK